jgi:hypothetical protein
MCNEVADIEHDYNMGAGRYIILHQGRGVLQRIRERQTAYEPMQLLSYSRMVN